MDIEFDPAKDAANIDKHGVSLSRAADLKVLTRVFDDRFVEPRMRAYGLMDGVLYCLAYSAFRGKIRAISLRRARIKEFRRYAQAD